MSAVSDRELYDDGVLRITCAGRPPVLALAGEIDELTYPGLIGALEQVVLGQSEIHVSMAAVHYCDLAGLRAIVRLTRTTAQPSDPACAGGRRVILYEVPAQLRSVLRILGWDNEPGLALAGRSPGQLPAQASAGEHIGAGEGPLKPPAQDRAGQS